MPSYLKKRGNKFHFRKRIPERFRHYFKQADIQISLDTDCEHIAQQKAYNLNLILKEYIDSLTPDDIEKADINAVITEARKYGFQYMPKKDIVNQASLVEFVNRVNTAFIAKNAVSKEAILGGAGEISSTITLSQAQKEYFEYESGNQKSMSENQLRKWKNPRLKTVKNFINQIGDKPLNEISRTDILEFRSGWVKRIEQENLSSSSANKEFGFLRRILNVAVDNHGLDLSVHDIFRNINLKKVEKSKRLPFSTEYIQNVLFQPLNTHHEISMLVYAMADTGARIGELVGLEDDDVLLDSEIPHIKIRPNGTRKLKTPQSERDIPLVGSSLYAFQQLQGPFKHYFGKSDLISSTGNKFLKENSLFPSRQHTLYSLRHSFEDRLTAVEPPDKLQAALMGHKYARPRYGLGPTLEQKHFWLSKIAFTVGA